MREEREKGEGKSARPPSLRDVPRHTETEREGGEREREIKRKRTEGACMREIMRLQI